MFKSVDLKPEGLEPGDLCIILHSKNLLGESTFKKIIIC